MAKVKYEEAVKESRWEAVEKVPTERGMFDARARCESFARAMLSRGWLVDFGVRKYRKDEEVEEVIKHFGLDM